MKVIAGNKYELQNAGGKGAEGEQSKPQTIQFATTDKDGNQTAGTTTEEVLRVLIERLKELRDETSSHENAVIQASLENALQWIQKRDGTGRPS